MAYDETLGRRVRALLQGRPGFAERRMFGGVGYLLHGNMACGVLNGALIVRVGPGSYEESLRLPHARPFDVTGRPMTGWVMVSPAGHDTAEGLAAWVERGASFAMTLPAK